MFRCEESCPEDGAKLELEEEVHIKLDNGIIF